MNISDRVITKQSFLLTLNKYVKKILEREHTCMPTMLKYLIGSGNLLIEGSESYKISVSHHKMRRSLVRMASQTTVTCGINTWKSGYLGYTLPCLLVVIVVLKHELKGQTRVWDDLLWMA